MTAHRACRTEHLVLGDAVVVELERDPHGRPREAVLVRDLSGVPRAYVNLCKHLPVPLDAGSREFFDWGKTALLCGTHGALYDLGTGYCFDGPCIGTILDPLEVREEGGWLVVLDEPALEDR